MSESKEGVKIGDDYNSLVTSVEIQSLSRDSLLRIGNEIVMDSLRSKFFFQVSYHYLIENDSINFRDWNDRTIQFSFQQKDTSGVAEAYWDLADFYVKQDKLDSAYYYFNASSKLYKEIGKEFYFGRMLLNQALVQTKASDFLGSEITSFQAIRLLKPMGKTKQLYLAYNNLGVIHNNLENFQKSVEYHRLAQEYNKSLDNDYYSVITLNNLGVAYKNMKAFDSAIECFKNALDINDSENIRMQAMLLDNIGHAKMFNGDLDEGYKCMSEALKLRTEIGHIDGISVNNLHLGDYFRLIKDDERAISLYKVSRDLSEKNHNHSDLLASLTSLASIDSANSSNYLTRHIELTDSLRKEERNIQNQFVRIRFETDQFKEDADQLSRQKIGIIVGAGIAILFLILIYIIQVQKSKNKKLFLEKKQQEANEKIYDLLLSSQQKFEEGSSKEKKRISRDLHDSVLSKFFGIRLNLEVLNNKTGKESEIQRAVYIGDLRKIEADIRTISHQLKSDSLLKETGFMSVIKELLNEVENDEDFKISLVADGGIDWKSVKNGVKINLYRILQEGLQNIRKYADAKNIYIKFDMNEMWLKFEIADDGVGFDLEKNETGIGLSNIEDRISEMKGKLKIKSSSRGTILLIKIPKKRL
ncbi:hypothetical protein APR41_17690 [Salegentibacter salinarum]|uniref:histidine kinase n=1 Tax=Salegentibacter salinarum TaxID=447422 RepID=A0A2N0TVJ6_9FLAO|nr:tetratricopeptide repeat-containing sensor histidine kinase [Salegentibacter salinarum]PKD18741.1 hypothetical protein APR41_17690 [Salegentibacter salinarum]SKB98586.1 Tetratricopeptide repeat-containing protein [Salegentibacter salinarum]